MALGVTSWPVAPCDCLVGVLGRAGPTEGALSSGLCCSVIGVEWCVHLVDLNAFSDFWRGFTLIHMQLAQINLHLLSLLKHSEGLMLDNS